MNTELLFVLGLLLMIFVPPILLLRQVLWEPRKAQKSTRWSRTQGIIEDSGLTVQNPGPKGGQRKYLARVRYAYEVDGATLHGHAIWQPGQHGIGTFDEAEELAERYFAGSRVTVYFDPRNPEVAVLEPGRNGGLYFANPQRLWMFALVPALVLFFVVIEWLAHLAR